MKINIKYPGILENYGISYDSSLEIPEGSTVISLLETYVTKPEYRAGNIIMVNGQLATATQVLSPGDIVSIFFPAIGG